MVVQEEGEEHERTAIELTYRSGHNSHGPKKSSKENPQTKRGGPFQSYLAWK